MKRFWPLLTAAVLTAPGAEILIAGTISYVPIPSAQSDANCGIARRYGYTSAVDGGNTRGTDRIVNGITLYALSGAGQASAMADNCTVNALSGTLTDAGLTSKNIAADGTVREALSDMVFNNAGGDNSQIEVVLDPESLEEGSTYDLRVYICSSSGQNRQVNLAFFGDGQDGAETGFFNEDDARTSAGRFQNANQVYYINYRYTWDGDSTPGITITQKFGGTPFCLYALTNELVFGSQASAGGAAAGGEAVEGGEATGGGEGAEAGTAGGDEGLSAGLVDQESDQVGVESDDFYGSESLNSNGRWVKLSKWGTCWQPTTVAEGWAPYTNGSWKDCDDCGWTFVSDEPWAWACYHYGRWAKVSIGCGWAWVPGTVWAPSWVSWRQGRGESASSIGWAPLPPEAGCNIGVGISSWVDSTCNIGPDYYTFINIRDFGSDSYWGCGCIYERYRNPIIIIDTFNITNICYNRHVNIYCGGPDYNWCNTRIRQLGGKECGKIYVNRYDNPERLGGKFARHEGNQLGLVSPQIHGNKNPRFKPKIAESAGADKIDHGWKGVKDKKQAQQVRNHIAQENKGKNPRNSPAKLPEGVAEKMKRHGGGAGQAAGQGGQVGPGGQAAGGGLKPGGKRRQGQGQMQGENLQGGQAQGGAAGGGDQHPGKGRRKGQGQITGAGGTAAGGGAAAGAAQGGGGDQHPGRNRGGKNRGGKAGGGQMQSGGGGQQTAGGTQTGGGAQQTAGGGTGRRHPGQKLKGGQATAGGGGQGTGAGAGAGKTGGAGQTGAGGQAAGGGQGQGGGGGKGRRQKGFAGSHAQSAGGQQLQQGGQGQGQAAQGGGDSSGGGRKGQGGRRKQKTQQQQGGQAQVQGAGQGGSSIGGAGGGGGGAGGGGQGPKRRHQQQQATQQAGGGGGQGQGQSGGGGGQGRRRQQQFQQQQQQQQQQQAQQQQLQKQRQLQLQQQRQQGGGGGGGGGKRRHATPTPPPG